jgi:hypothetical protein
LIAIALAAGDSGRELCYLKNQNVFLPSTKKGTKHTLSFLSTGFPTHFSNIICAPCLFDVVACFH